MIAVLLAAVVLSWGDFDPDRFYSRLAEESVRAAIAEQFGPAEANTFPLPDGLVTEPPGAPSAPGNDWYGFSVIVQRQVVPPDPTPCRVAVHELWVVRCGWGDARFLWLPHCRLVEVKDSWCLFEDDQ